MSEAEKFTSEEWRTLQLAPFWAFMAGTKADKRVDSQVAAQKVDAFLKEVSEAALYREKLVREVLTSIRLNQKGWIAAYEADSRSIFEGLTQVRTVLDAKADSTEAVLFKSELMSFVDKGARASGPIGKDEETASLAVALLLGFNPRVYARTGAANRHARAEMRQLFSAIERYFR